MAFLPGFATVFADLKKIFALANIFAAFHPSAAPDLAKAEQTIADLQPIVKAVQNAANGALDHAGLVNGVTDAIAKGSASLVAQGLISGTTDQHVQALAAIIPAAVAVSGLAAPTNPAA